MDKKKKGSPLPFILGFIAALILGWWIFPQVLFSQWDQPFNYSHPAHLDLGLDCCSCHQYREDGSFSGIPGNIYCSNCHQDIITGTPSEKIFVNDYLKKDKEVPWKIYQKQPDNVYFSHIAHQDYECTRCHPDMSKVKELPGQRRSKLSGYSRTTMTMDECERCHALEDESNACYICHK